MLESPLLFITEWTRLAYSSSVKPGLAPGIGVPFGVPLGVVSGLVMEVKNGTGDESDD
jgi:hypothetical protein